MNVFRRFRHFFTAPLITALITFSMPVGIAQAGLVGTDQIIASSVARADRDKITDFMARNDVRDQMRSWGVDPAEADRRIAALSDAEIAALSARLGDDPAGKGVVGAVIGAAVIVFIVLLITDITGYTDVFPFTRDVN